MQRRGQLWQTIWGGLRAWSNFDFVRVVAQNLYSEGSGRMNEIAARRWTTRDSKWALALGLVALVTLSIGVRKIAADWPSYTDITQGHCVPFGGACNVCAGSVTIGCTSPIPATWSYGGCQQGRPNGPGACRVSSNYSCGAQMNCTTSNPNGLLCPLVGSICKEV